VILPRLALAAFLSCMATAMPCSAEEAGCGTVILPTGLGASAPAGINSLNPMLTTGLYAHEVIDLLYRPLVWIDEHGQPDPTRGLAESVTTQDDGESFLVTLHDWRWSDGVPVTAEDLVFTLDLVRSLGPRYVYYGTGGMPTLIASWRVVSPHQVELRMTRKVNPRWFVSAGLGNLFFPLPKHVFAGLDAVELRRRQNDPTLFSVSDGPFLLKSFAFGRHIVLDANPLYGGHKPEVRRLVVSFPTGNTALEQLRAGSLDMANIPFLLSDFAKRLPGLSIVTPSPHYTYGDGYFNFRSAAAPYLADLSVRRAITRAIDQKEIIALVFHGRAAVDHGPVPSAMQDLQSDKARAGYPELSFDPDAARALLLKDGWAPGADGIMTKHGRRLEIAIQTAPESSNGVLMAQIIQRDLRRIGIDISLQLIGFNQLLAILAGNGHDWQMVLMNWSIPTYPDVHDFFSSDGTENYGHFRDPTMDALNRAVMFGSGDGPLHATQDYAAENAPHLYLPGGTPQVLVRPGIGGVSDFLGPNGMWSAELLTLSPPLACPTGGDHAPAG
jgi:peptide/nickel transport system substrate-binding protein